MTDTTQYATAVVVGHIFPAGLEIRLEQTVVPFPPVGETLRLTWTAPPPARFQATQVGAVWVIVDTHDLIGLEQTAREMARTSSYTDALVLIEALNTLTAKP